MKIRAFLLLAFLLVTAEPASSLTSLSGCVKIRDSRV